MKKEICCFYYHDNLLTFDLEDLHIQSKSSYVIGYRNCNLTNLLRLINEIDIYKKCDRED